MKTSSEKSSTTTSTTATQTASQPFFAKAGGGGFFEPATARTAPVVQMKMTVNKPGDKFEQEADRMAYQIMRMPAPQQEKLQRQPEEKLQKKENPLIGKAPLADDKLQKKENPLIGKASSAEDKLQKAPQKEEKIQRKSSDGTPGVSAGTQSAIQNSTTGGQPLSGDVRSYMEPRFGADFSNVRIHSDSEAGSLSNQLSARAFTRQNHIFFSRDQYQPGTGEGKQLLAHELTHTIQQGHAVQRSPQVSTTATPPTIQRLGIQDVLDYLADRAYHIPGFRMLTVVLGFNPINRQSVSRSAANILRALIELIPGGHLITQALDNHGVINRAAAWVEQRLATLGDLGSDLMTGLRRFRDSLGWSDFLHPGNVWDRAQNLLLSPITRLISFGDRVATDILQMVKDAVLRPLAGMARGTRGYDLLKAILGEDPITREPVPRDADTLIGGFMRLIGQEEIWQNIRRANAVARAWAWFQGALSGLLAFARSIPRRIIETLTSLTFRDVITVVGAFSRIVTSFANIATEFLSWGLNQVISLLEILFSVVAPGAVPFVRRAGAAFQQILRNPVGFVGNLVRAGVQGFRLFSNNILSHLRAGLIGWLTGALTGLTLPARWDFRGILSLVLQILGLTWQNVRGRLVRVLGERPVAVLEATFGLVMTMVREGPAAAWRELMQHLGNLQEMLFGRIREWVQRTVVQQAVLRIASMLNPAGAVIQAIIAIYNTIMFFVERIRQIGAVVESVVNSLSAIASGAIGQAANAVEQTMARMVPVIISFLARLINLGGISERIQEIMRRIQQPINNAIDRVIDWIVAQARRLANMLTGAGRRQPDERTVEQKEAALNAAVSEARTLQGTADITPERVRARLLPIQQRHRLTSINLEQDQGNTYHIVLTINPSRNTSPKQYRPKFTLASGNFETHEGYVIVAATITRQPIQVHMISRHGMDVPDSVLMERVEILRSMYQQERATKIGSLANDILGLNDSLGTALRTGNTGAVDRIRVRIEEFENRLRILRATNYTDVDSMYSQLEEWRRFPPPRATRFHRTDIMNRSVTAAIQDAENARRIDNAFTSPDGNIRPIGTSVEIRKEFDQVIGIGYELAQNHQAVRISTPLRRVVAFVRLVDPVQRKYLIETAYPEGRR